MTVIDIRRATAADGKAIGIVHAASWEAAYAPLFDPEFRGRRDRVPVDPPA